MSDHSGENRIRRREFLAGAATTAAAFTIVRPSAVRGSEANSTITLGLIGCGGRGNWIAERFVKHGYRFTACADYFQDRVDAFGPKYNVDENRRFTALSGYRHVLDTDVDAVVIESPPCFHPEQASAAVDAGKHVYVAKPIAVDVPGCLTIGEAGRKATDKELVFLVDFQTRANEYYREAARRVHDGAIGKLVTGDARYPWEGGNPPPPTSEEEKLRRWYCFRELSGEGIVEQAIHSLDVATWFMNADPVSAIGYGVRKGLRDHGNINDAYSLIYTFPDDVHLTFHCVQCIPKAPAEIPCRVYGSDGYVDSDYYSHVWIQGRKRYEGGKFNDLYDSGAVVNIKEFHQFVTEGRCDNPTVAPSVRSNLTAVLGRLAGYAKGPVTWKEMMEKKEALALDRSHLKA
jgi:predicted dehydrogenase